MPTKPIVLEPYCKKNQRSSSPLTGNGETTNGRWRLLIAMLSIIGVVMVAQAGFILNLGIQLARIDAHLSEIRRDVDHNERTIDDHIKKRLDK